MGKAKTTQIRTLAKSLRAHSLRMVHRAKASHIGTCLSAADILAVLYGTVLNVDPSRPDWPDRDRLVVSKGHAAAVLYAALAERGFFPLDWLETYSQDGTRLGGHITSHAVPGVEISTGALGHGLSIGCGMALAAKHRGAPYRVFVLLSDGELDEGSVWEAFLFAPQHRLGNLVAVVDCNGLQGFGRTSEVLELEPLKRKFEAFRWSVREVDGHDVAKLLRALSSPPRDSARPTVVLARTVKGKGVSFMEDKLEWHYRSPNDEQLAQALRELEARA